MLHLCAGFRVIVRRGRSDWLAALVRSFVISATGQLSTTARNDVSDYECAIVIRQPGTKAEAAIIFRWSKATTSSTNCKPVIIALPVRRCRSVVDHITFRPRQPTNAPTRDPSFRIDSQPADGEGCVCGLHRAHPSTTSQGWCRELAFHWPATRKSDDRVIENRILARHSVHVSHRRGSTALPP